MNILFSVTGNLQLNASHNIRNASLIKLLSNAGHQIYIVMDDTSKKKDDTICGVLNESIVFCNSSISHISSHKAKETKQSLQKSSLKTRLALLFARMLPYDPTFLRIPKILKKSTLPNRIDIIITSSDPISSHLIGKKLKPKYPQAKWIQYWGDVMSEDIQFSIIKRRLCTLFERKLLRKADSVVYTNPAVVDYMKKKYPEVKATLTWIPTPFELKKYEYNEISKEYRIGYFGAYSSKNRNIAYICEAAQKCNVPIIVAGNGDIELPSNVEKHEKCSIEELSALERSVSIVTITENKYVTLSDGSSGCLQVPGKLYHYANSGYYVLIACEGALLKQHYSVYNRFVFCDNNTDSIAEAISDIVNGCYKDTIHIVEEFGPEKILSRWEELMRQ